ncbi:cytochrome c oxidase assembly factor 3, mitochondrial [Neocloeon triangulifer]|uniref:cytochrome c oxidase assembly factor 3, mitochondrial n=1 Tax=Neocloeon triangulifer TaxID=2078957 RepID=UPI00286F1038|nr:cytochrome c oxidase assembly factor 3, mitochondrial [Neocloeon triangulifer]XP_059469796.1 cytochrome c oxidase assembly factor 3, mitochondrial [Neocloeon triangulifer]
MGKEDLMPKVDFSKEKPNESQLQYIRLIEEKNRERVEKLRKLRVRNLWTAGLLGTAVFSIYAYSMLSVRQESFLDDFNEPARENSAQ